MQGMNRAGRIAVHLTGTPRRALRASMRLALASLLLAAVATVAFAQAEPDVAAPPDPDPPVETEVAPPPVVESPVAQTPVVSRRAAAPADPRERLRDVADWVQWKNTRQIASLPAEARLFFRRGLLAHQSGQRAEALANVRGAIELDPSFVQPHLTLAGWALFGDPAQTLVHCAAVVERLRHDFNLQLDLAANALTLGFEALFAGLLFAGLIVVYLRRDEIAHGFQEQLAGYISRTTARLWIPLLLSLPFMAGIGLTLPVLLLLGFLWPQLRVRERALYLMLAAAAVLAPLTLTTLDRFALALRTDGRPFYELPTLEHAAWDSGRQARLESQALRDPDNGFAQFALGWYSRLDSRLEKADRAYDAALRAWPDHSAVLTDLGNVVAMRGQADRALELYRRAAASDPQNAAAHFNAAQLLTRRFDYATAQAELRQASAIDFDLVKRFQSRAGANGMLPLVDVWPGPRTFWTALADAPLRGSQPLPLSLRGWLETSGWSFSVASLLTVLLGVFAGRWQHKQLPLRFCSNCGVVVCRRCAKRRREAALCQECDAIGAGAETQEFSRVLLLQHRARRRDGARYLGTALAALVPGFGLLAHHRVFGPTLLLSCAWLLGHFALGHALPFSVSARLTLPGGEVPGVMLWAGILFIYIWSLLGYFVLTSAESRRESQNQAVSRGRITQATRRQPPAAA